MDVFVLWHIHKLPGGDNDEKLIGVYSSQEMAESARETAIQLPGFKETTDGFQIDRYEVDEDHWTEGYVTVTHEELLREHGKGSG